MRCLLIGNYGAANFGDEALKEWMLRHFPEVTWQVISAAPSRTELPRLPGGLRSLLSFSWIQTIKAFASTDGVVFGGGTLFTDIESVRACFLWWLHAKAAYVFRKPVYFAFQGIGPFHTRIGRWFARSAFRNAAFISVRDEQSLGRMQMIVPGKKIVQSFDPILTDFYRQSDDRSQNILTLIPRHNSGQAFKSFAAREWGTGMFASVVIASLQPGDPAERDFCRSLEQAYPSARVIPVRTAQDLRQAVASSRCIVTARFHGAIAALGMAKNVVLSPQAKGDKIDALQPFVDDPARVKTLLDLVKIGEESLRESLQTQSGSVRHT